MNSSSHVFETGVSWSATALTRQYSVWFLTLLCIFLLNSNALTAQPPGDGTDELEGLGDPLKLATELKVFDISDKGDGDDLQIDFRKALNEASILEYRVCVVKKATAEDFDLADALNLSSGEFLSVTPNGSNVSTIVGSAVTDVDGDPIITNYDYQLFVLSYVDPLVPASNALSDPSPVIRLEYQLLMAQNPYWVDSTDVGDARDFFVRFDPAVDEAGLVEYRLVFSKADRTVKTEDLLGLTTDRYTTVIPFGSVYELFLTPGQRDSDGDPVRQGSDYSLYILTVADPAVYPADASMRHWIDLQPDMPTRISSFSSAVDVANWNDGRDLAFAFGPALDEVGIDRYRVVAVPAAEVADFEADDALFLPMGRFREFAPAGAGTSGSFLMMSQDVNGAPILNGSSYGIFVLSIMDGASAFGRVLAAPSSIIELNTDDLMVSAVTALDAGDSETAADLQVSFDMAASEDQLLEYRVIAWPADVPPLEPFVAVALPSDRFVQILPGAGPVTMNFSPGSKDGLGDLIVQDEHYFIYVVSWPDPTRAELYAVTGSSDAVVLRGYTAADLVVTDVSNAGSAADVQMEFNKAVDEGPVAAYRVIAVPEFDAEDFDAADALALNPDRYLELPVSGTDFSLNLEDLDLATDGLPVEHEISYQYFVYSVVSAGAVINSPLSLPSDALTLTAPEFEAFVPVLEDAGNSGTTADIQLLLEPASEESAILEYEIILVPESEAAMVGIRRLNELPSSAVTSVTPLGAAQTVQLDGSQTDWNGAAVIEDESYLLFVRSEMDPAVCASAVSSGPFGPIELRSATGLQEIPAFGSVIQHPSGLEFIFQDGAAHQVNLFDLQGRLLDSKLMSGGHGKFDLQGLPDGLYLWQVDRRAAGSTFWQQP